MALKSSELTIFRGNAKQSVNNKEAIIRLLTKLEKEKALLEHKRAQMERKYKQSKGYKYVKKDYILQ